MNFLEYSSESVDSLVAPRPHLMQCYREARRMLFCTVSPNPMTKHWMMIKGKRVKMPYGRIPQRIQYEYCLKIVKKCYLELLPNCMLYGVAELNTSGNIHVHFIIYDSETKSNVMLDVFRRDILNCEEVLYNLNNKQMNDYMNNIVFLTKSKDEIHAYFNKCNADMIQAGFLNFTYNLH